MPKLKKWFFKKDDLGSYYLYGIVFEHKLFKDGIYVNTSEIKDLQRVDDFLVCKTLNTEYVLELSECTQKEVYIIKNSNEPKILNNESRNHLIDYYITINIIINREAMNIQESVNKNTIIDANEIYSKYPDELKIYSKQNVIDDFNSIVKLKQEYFKNIFKGIEINNDELYLSLDSKCSNSFEMAVIRNKDGFFYKIEPNFNIGMFQDSVIISDINKEYEFRYFSCGNYIHVYAWSKSIKGVLVHNKGNAPMKIHGSAIDDNLNKKYEIKAGEKYYVGK